MRDQRRRSDDRIPAVLALIAVFCLSILATGSAAASPNNPCSLLTATEVEAVLGEPLAGPPFRVDGYEPTATGAACRYETKAFRAITVEVDWSHGSDAFSMFDMVSGIAGASGLKGVLTLTDGTELHGAWDQATMFLCCQFNALRDDQRVMIDISATTLTQKDAGGLADKAVQRLDSPQDVADDMGVAEALARNKTRPVIASACTLVTRAEAEAIVGTPLTAEPDGNESRCTYVWTPSQADYTEEINLMITWRGGFAEMRATQSATGTGLDMMADQGLDLTQDATAPDTLFEAYNTSIIGVMGVRKDVLLSIESGPMSEMAAEFLAAAAQKL